MEYIMIGESVYGIDTDEERAAAKEALREHGIGSAPVWVSPSLDHNEGENYKNGQVLFAD